MKRTDLKEQLKSIGLTQEDVGDLLDLDRVSVGRKLGGAVTKAGDIEFLIATWQVLTPAQKEAVRNLVRSIRMNRPKPPPASAD